MYITVSNQPHPARPVDGFWAVQQIPKSLLDIRRI